MRARAGLRRQPPLRGALTLVWIALSGVAVFWLLARRRLFELWRDVQAARRQVDIQRLRRAELAPRLADALGDRLDPLTWAALAGDDAAARDTALADLPAAADDEPPELTSMRADLADIDHRLHARLRVLAAENMRYRWLAPRWIARWVGAPLPADLQPVPPALEAEARAAGARGK